MRNRFDLQLEELNRQLTTMGAMCESSIAACTKGLLESDDELCHRVVDMGMEIDRQESDIEAHCLRLLLRQQPIARDLRLISSALKMITDMERIGDQSADIAEIALMHPDKVAVDRVPVREMAAATIRMVTESVESFVKRDVKLAREVIAYDDVVDRLFDRVKNDLISLITADPALGEEAIDLLMVAKYFERIGDHATNIADWVVFSITASHDTKHPDEE